MKFVCLLTVCLHIVGFVIILLDFVVYLIMLGPFYTAYKYVTTRTVFAKISDYADINEDGEHSKVWRSVDAIKQKKLTDTLEEGMSTIYEALVKSYEKNSEKRAQGMRPVDRMRKDEGFKFPAKVFGKTKWRTYRELEAMAREFGQALRSIGVEPQPDGAENIDHKGILIYDETSADWMVCAQGAMSQSVVVATCYATLGMGSVVKAVNQGGVTALVCNRKAVASALASMKEMPTLKAIVYTDTLCEVSKCAAPPPEVSEAPQGLVRSLAEFLELGRANLCPPTPPTRDSIAVIMYTSGSTGDPKGVLVKQKNLLAMVAAVQTQLHTVLPEGSVYLGYLPLAHILEMAAEFTYYSLGHTIGYADHRSLLPGPQQCYPTGGLEEFKPTLMAGVPKVWENIKAGAQRKIRLRGPAAEFLIGLAIKMKATAKRQHRFTPVFNLLLKTFKDLVGGRLVACLSGGGAISAEVQEWCRTALDCPLVQGYGLTETCAGATIQFPDDLSIGIAGTPLSSIEVTLHSEPDFKDSNGKSYLCNDKRHSNGKACEGRGEVWLRGTNVTDGYYKMPELTAKDFDSKGWFHTGDIGMFTPGGALLIIDRKKNLVKLKGGEYVALEKMNVAYNNSPFVNIEAGGCCSYAGADIDKPVCLAQCLRPALQQVLKDKGKQQVVEDGITDDDLCRDPDVQDAVLKSFKKCAAAAELTALETVVAVYPLLNPWNSDENGCLTATQKIVSSKIYKLNAKELESLKVKGGMR